MAKESLELSRLNQKEAEYVVALINTINNEDDIINLLSNYIIKINDLSEKYEEERVISFATIVEKGMIYLSKQAKSSKYYYMGYYAGKQERLLQEFKNRKALQNTEALFHLKYIKEILGFLYTKGSARLSDLADYFNINRSNLSRKMNLLIDNNLVDKKIGPKIVIYELTSYGYSICNDNSLNLINRLYFSKSNSVITSWRFIKSKHPMKQSVCTNYFKQNIIEDDNSNRTSIIPVGFLSIKE